MKDITRIHIAKVSYDIELPAKKELEEYLQALESYGNDAEIINDIEIRMTELLTERGVKNGGVITQKDVDALKEQLGDPSEIMGEEAVTATGHPQATSTAKKLFRDTDSPVIGGVLSGIAHYFGVNPLWVRILFIILAVASLGTALLLYVVLWIAVPPARTAADKLQMRGQPVTAQSIREFNESETNKSSHDRTLARQRAVTAAAGVLATVGAIFAALGTIAAIIGVFTAGRDDFNALPDSLTGVFIAAFILAVASGILLTTLLALSAFAAFTQKLTKRVAITMGAIVLLGLASFGTAVGLAQYGTSRHESIVRSSMEESAITLPAGTASATNLTVDAKGVKVIYNVTSGALSATLNAPSDTKGKVSASLDGKTLRVAATGFDTDDCRTTWRCYDLQEIVINGPALTNISQAAESDLEYHAVHQEKLATKTDARAHFTITSGTISQLAVTAREGSIVRTGEATISDITADMSHEAELSAGVIERFTMKSPNACPEYGSKVVVDIREVTSGSMTLNSKAMPAKWYDSACANVIIDHEDWR